MLQLRNCAGRQLPRPLRHLAALHDPGEAPVGLMLMGETMGDARVFASPPRWKPLWPDGQ